MVGIANYIINGDCTWTTDITGEKDLVDARKD